MLLTNGQRQCSICNTIHKHCNQQNISHLLCTYITLRVHLKRGKGKGHPRTGHEGPEGKQRYSSALSLTSALEWGGWSTLLPGRFTTRETRYTLYRRPSGAPEPAWMICGREKSLAPARSRTPDGPGCGLLSTMTSVKTAIIPGFRMWQAIV
jgi:hypothetical protein